MRLLKELNKLSAVEVGGSVRSQAKRFKFAVNRSGKNKDWDFKKLANNYQDIQGDIYTVATEVKNGYALCAGLLGGNWRAKSNVIGSHWILLDIDNSKVLKDELGETVKDANGRSIKVYDHQLTLDEALALPFIQQHCALIYTTASHRPDWHKFRLIFLLPEYVSDIDIYESIVRLLMEHLPHDPSCKDASRVFYGSTGAEFPLIQPQAVLPSDWVERAVVLGEAEKQAKQQRLVEQRKRQAEFEAVAQSEGWNIDTLIRDALRHIPPRMLGSGNYEECRDVVAALTSYYGAGAVAIAESWSPSIPGSTWNVEQKVRSFEHGRANGITYRTIFWLATKYGWQYPKFNKTFKKYDPINDPAYQAYIQAEQERDLAEAAEERVRNLNFFKGFCNAVRQDKRKKVRERVAEITTEQTKKQRYVRGTLPEYQPGLTLSIFTLETMSDRNAFVYEAARKGWKHLLDQSGTGSGKSYFAGLLEPERFEFGGEAAVWYLTNESRNPSTRTIEANFEALPVRNHGLEVTEKTTPMNYPVMKPTFDRPGEGNCRNAHLFLLAGEKGFETDAEAANNPICAKCPFNVPLPGEKGSQCANHEGGGYGFRHQRRLAMASNRLRLNPQSAPANIPNHVAMVWEEISTQLKVTTRKTTAQELNTEWWKIESEAPEIYSQLRPVRKFLSGELSTPSERWGTVAKNCVEALDLQLLEKERTAILEQLYSILCPSLEELIKVESIDNSELRKQVKKAESLVNSLFHKIEACNNLEREKELWAEFKEAVENHDQLSEQYEAAKNSVRGLQSELREEALSRLKKAPTQALWHVLNILFFPEQGAGNFRIREGEVAVTLPDQRLRQLVNAATTNLYLDATVNQQVLKAFLGIDDLLVCELEQEESRNLKHYQVIGFGRCGKDRAQSTNERLVRLHDGIKARENTGDLQIADFKGVQGFEAKIRHLSNSRGSNEIAGSPVLVVHGLPKPNQGAIEDEYACLPNPGFTFQQYYQYRVDAEVKQLTGRQRSDRYPNKKFSIYWVNEDTMPFLVEKIEAIDISYQAAPKSQRVKQSVFEAICEAARLGVKLTQKLIAQLAQVTQGFISQWFRERGGWKYWRDLLTGKPPEYLQEYRAQLSDEPDITALTDEEYRKQMSGSDRKALQEFSRKKYLSELEPVEQAIAEVLPMAMNEATKPEQVLEAVSEFFEDLGTDGFKKVWKAIGWMYRRRFIGALLALELPSGFLGSGLGVEQAV
ncbi:PriCT-2 domain-containing protein [Cyanobacteria bacterium FACHB-63]|nr:PriCT-2 domain-containing protein [Cyanobacteria bacterium FACHB-63]